MKQRNLYFPLWKKYIKVILLLMKKSSVNTQELELSKAEFETYGNRPASDYVFNLEIENGKLSNEISGTAVARDLLEIILSEKESKDLLKDKHYSFKLGKEFILRINSSVIFKSEKS